MKSPDTAWDYFEQDPYAFMEEHNWKPGDPFYLQCADDDRFCCCTVCQGASGPGGAKYPDFLEYP